MRLMILTFLSFVILSIDIAAVAGIPVGILETTSSLFAKVPAKDGAPVLKGMLEKVRKIRAYSFDCTVTTFSKGKKVTETGRFFVKSPNMIRFEAVRAGKKSGSVVVRRADGKIRGKTGGLLGGVHLTLSPDSKMLKASNGFSVVESDMASLLSWAVGRLKGGLSCITGQIDSNARVLEMVDKEGDVVDRLAVDPEANLPMGWSVFENNKLSCIIRVENLVVKADLPDSLFTLAGFTGAKAIEDQVYELSPDLAAVKQGEGKVPPSAGALKELERVIGMLRSRALELKKAQPLIVEGPVGAAAASGWKPGATEMVVISATEMESILDVLRNMTPGLKVLEEKKGWTNLVSGDWTEQLRSCSESVETIIDFALEDEPDKNRFAESLDRLLDSLDSLEKTRKRAMDLM